jgi:salicylate hydroxylase
VQSFSKFYPGVRELIDRADVNLKVWQLYDMKSLPTWIKHRVALIGDAAHPFQPCKLSRLWYQKDQS